MPNAISNDLKQQILERVREGKTTVVEIAKQHGVNVNTVYNWISKSVHGTGNSLLVVSKLKRENAFLKQLLGQLMLDVERGKKNRHG
jgi:transposase-like protein